MEVYDGEGDLSVERRPDNKKKVRGERGAYERVALSRWAEGIDPRSVVVAVGCGRAPPALPGRVFATEIKRDLLESMRSVASGESLKIRRLALTELPRLLASSSSGGDEGEVGDGFDWTAEDLSVLREKGPLVVAVLSGCSSLEASGLQKALVECLAVSDGRMVTLWLSGGCEEAMLGDYGLRVELVDVGLAKAVVVASGVPRGAARPLWLLPAASLPAKYTAIEKIGPLEKHAFTREEGELRRLSIATLSGPAAYLACARLLVDAAREMGLPPVEWMTKPQYCRYGPGDHFERWHVDETDEPVAYKTLGAIVILNDEYEGGELDFEDGVVVGSVVFDARRDRHRVRKVTSGLRETLVFWATDRDVSEQYETCLNVRILLTSRTSVRAPKIVIWDLDGTLWYGTLEEEEAVRPRTDLVRMVRDLAGRGVLSAVCSRAPAALAKKALRDLGVWELMVFPAFVDVASKGNAVRSLLESMGLRAADAYFVDDSPTNRADVLLANPTIASVLDPDLAASLDCREWGRDDPDFERVRDYKLLETKFKARSFVDDDTFLRSCSIEVEVIPVMFGDEPDSERIADLLNRANRLNFTKRRVTASWYVLDDDAAAFPRKGRSQDTRKCWKVRCVDAFGDYGIVGVVAIRYEGGWKLRHLTFSCRCAGMRVAEKVTQWLIDTYGPFDGVGFAQGVETDFIRLRIRDEPDVTRRERSSTTTRKALARGWCAAMSLAPFLESSATVVTSPRRYESLCWSGLDVWRAAVADPEALRTAANARQRSSDDDDDDDDDVADIRVVQRAVSGEFDVVIHDLEIDVCWPRGILEGVSVPIELPHRTARSFEPGLAQEWAALWAKQGHVQVDFDMGRMPTAEQVLAEVAALRASLPESTLVVLLAMPENLWDEELASASWREVLRCIPTDLRVALQRHVSKINQTLLLTKTPGVAVVDRGKCLRNGDVQDHTHFARRAILAIADAVRNAIDDSPSQNKHAGNCAS